MATDEELISRYLMNEKILPPKTHKGEDRYVFDDEGIIQSWVIDLMELARKEGENALLDRHGLSRMKLKAIMEAQGKFSPLDTPAEECFLIGFNFARKEIDDAEKLLRNAETIMGTVEYARKEGFERGALAEREKWRNAIKFAEDNYIYLDAYAKGFVKLLKKKLKEQGVEL